LSGLLFVIFAIGNFTKHSKMTQPSNEYNDVDKLLASIIKKPNMDLRKLFEARLQIENISFSAALAKIKVEHRALNGALDASQKRHDLLMLGRLADFLHIPRAEFFPALVDDLEAYFAQEVDAAEKELFIRDSFNLPYLKQIGLIDDTKDFAEIERSIVEHFGYSSIFDYRNELFGATFSSGKPKSKSSFEKEFWAARSAKVLNSINNFFPYDRIKLKEYVLGISWYSTNVKKGLYQVIRDLFKLGVTVILRPYDPKLYARAATFPVKDKWGIVLTNYSDNYPTLWFALLHELHHVLFDAKHVINTYYHITGGLDLFSPHEVEADEFANTMLLSPEKFEQAKPHIENRAFIDEFARVNQVHPSVIYARYCWEMQEADPKVWAKFKRLIPTVAEAIPNLKANPWQSKVALQDIAKQTENEYFKGV
jgi:HTH-type transcriptional regulator / antitoxin HigA